MSVQHLRRSKVLEDAMPRLRDLFRTLATRGDGTVPLFPPHIERRMWKAVVAPPRNRPSPNDDVDAAAARQAAVLVPLVSCDGVPSLLFTTRAGHLSSHASEVAFPGGHFEADHDGTLVDTALREAREELLGPHDYPWDQVEVLGRASPVPSLFGTPVTAVIGVLPSDVGGGGSGGGTCCFPGFPGEVEDVFCVSLGELLEVETAEPSERFGSSSVPVFPTGDGRRIWGLTAALTRPLLHRLFGPVFMPDHRHLTTTKTTKTSTTTTTTTRPA